MTNMFGRLQGLRKKKHKERERIKEGVKMEDILIRQIDELKEKARNLQNTLMEKQQAAAIVNREVENYAGRMSRNLEGQLSQMDRSLDAKLAQISIQVENGTKETEEQLQEVKKQIEDITGRLNEGENQQVKASVDELVARLDMIKNELTAKLDIMKNELSEKVHTENVKSYRNMQALIEELDGKLATLEVGRRSMKSVKRYLRAGIIIGVLNLLALAGIILYEAGILNYLPF